MVSSDENSNVSLWEVGNNKPISTIKELWMSPIRSLIAHPISNSVAAQMQNKEIIVFNTESGFTIDRQRSFSGHIIDSFGCRITISPDGQFIASGDKTGALYIWNWKTTKLVKTFKLHNDVIIKAQWSPLDSSQIVTGSNDNTLCLLD